ncbi:jg2722, partial [Pararge aegeria aegeria]
KHPDTRTMFCFGEAEHSEETCIPEISIFSKACGVVQWASLVDYSLNTFSLCQLYYDGFQPIAATLSAAVHADPPCPPSDRLLNLMMVGLQHEPDRKDRLAASSGAEHLLGTTGFDLEFEMDASSLAPEPATYETAYVTSHKMSCRAGAFSSCGQLVATGSVDASIKV